ncbi:MAG: PHP domain-containing protein [Treponema sp.]|nr:PHP domain-containing protein [Treponema sp.]MCL2272664.1 PHP domain-containing protein [Treponema sp.]
MLADLHNHSCLSPCGSLDLSPRSILETGAGKGIKLMALTDHNSSLNCPPFAKLSAQYGIIPIFGLEATTNEEIHVLCLFTSLDASMAFSEYAYSIITPFLNNPQKTGDQVYVDADDNIEGEVEYYLVNPLSLSIDDIGAKVIEYGGIVIPAHVDRPAFSMSSQLGLLVDGPWSALECVRIPPVVNDFPLNTKGFPLITSSDAHYLEYIGRRPFELDVTAEELQPGGSGTEANMEIFKQALGRRLKW